MKSRSIGTLLGIIVIVTSCSGSDDSVGSDLSSHTDALDTQPVDNVVGEDNTSSIEDTTPETVEDVPVPTGINYIIIADDDLESSARAHAAYRETTGYRTRVETVSGLVPEGLDEETLRLAVHGVIQEALDERLGDETVFVLLFGDVPSGESDEGGIPVAECDNDWGDCLTDNRYADVDGDMLPDVALGRATVHDADSSAAFTAKMRAWDEWYETGEFNKRVAMYVGEAGFTPEIDALLEIAMFDGLKAVPYEFDIVGTWDNSTSAYYYEPFEEKVIDLFNDGSLMAVYVGHGNSQWTQGLTPTEIDQIHCDMRKPVTFLFACHAGNFTNDDDSIVELLTVKDDGPIAAVGSTDVSHPYGNAVLAYETQRVVLDERPATVGEAFTAAKIAMVAHTDDFRAFLDGVAVIEVPPEDQDLIEIQHLDLYNLVGDPASPMHFPQTHVLIDKPVESLASGAITVSGTAYVSDGGTAIVSLETERDVIYQDLEEVDPDNADAEVVARNWEKANDKAVVRMEVPVTNNKFSASLSWDGNLMTGDYYIKVYAQDDDGVDGIGVLRVVR